MINFLSYKVIQKQNFIIFDKGWLEKWKNIVGYEIIKDKCKNSQNGDKLNYEINKLFKKLNTKQKLEELSKMDCSKFKRNELFDISNLSQLNELFNFEPILDTLSFYFIKWCLLLICLCSCVVCFFFCLFFLFVLLCGFCGVFC